MNARTLLVLAGAAIVLAGLAALVVNRNRQATSIQDFSGAMFPGFAEKADAVSSITVLRDGVTATVRRAADAPGTWTLEQKNNYPVNVNKVRQLVSGLTALTKIEPKTSRPERYSEIGVEDPSTTPPAAESEVTDPTQPAEASKSEASLVTLKDAAGQTLLSTIVGKSQPGSSASSSSVFVRLAGEAQSWLAQGQLEVPRDLNAWLETQIINLARERVRSAAVTPGRDDGSALVVARGSATDVGFTLADMPDGRELKFASAPDQTATALSWTTFEDVAPAGSITPPEGVTPTQYEARTFDGLVIGVRLFARDGSHWASFTASYDAASVLSPPTAPPEVPPNATAEQIAAAEEAAKKSAQEAADAKAAEVQKEAADFNARHANWLYKIPEFKAKSLMTTLADLLKEAPAPVPSGPAGPAADSPANDPSAGNGASDPERIEPK